MGQNPIGLVFRARRDFLTALKLIRIINIIMIIVIVIRHHALCSARLNTSKLEEVSA